MVLGALLNGRLVGGLDAVGNRTQNSINLSVKSTEMRGKGRDHQLSVSVPRKV